MSTDTQSKLSMRTAFEALRAGVPNRAAITLLGSVEDAIEDKFEAGLDAAWSDAPVPGLLFAGGFGSGKSHLLGFMREAALKRNFVVSTVSVSKETPLSAPLALFTAAIRGTLVPGHADDVMTVALAELQRQARPVDGLVEWAGGALSPVFSALLHLLRPQMEPELLRQIEGFLAGDRPPGRGLNQALIKAGARGRFDLSGLTEASLLLQRERFTPHLLRAAGFAGWCVLIDEVELIGRYAPMPRARAYAELGRWLGLAGATPIAGLHVAAAITDDFAAELIHGRQDAEKLPDRLRQKGLANQAELAQAAMRAIVAAPLLRPPQQEDLKRHEHTLRLGYSEAYDWPAPSLPVAARRANRTMRQHVRGWITQWDMLRLEGRTTELAVGTIAANYQQDDALDQASKEN